MLVEECNELDAKIAWKLTEGTNQLEGMGDLNQHITLLRQASKHSQTAQELDAEAQQKEEYIMHLLTVAGEVLIFNEENQNPFIASLLQSVKELREKAEEEDGCFTY